MIKSLISIIVKFLNFVNGGILVLFPSYRLIENFSKLCKQEYNYKQFKSKLFIEPKNSVEMKTIYQNYLKWIN